MDRWGVGNSDSVVTDMEWYWIFLILAVAVMVFGFGVVLVNRRQARRSVESARSAPRSTAPPRKPTEPSDGDRGGLVAERETAVEPSVEQAIPPAPLRDRLAKARMAFSGAFVGVLGRSTITDESWDELEEALLRADVGLSVTGALLDRLKQRVKDQQIDEPSQLLDALQADMVAQLQGSDRTINFDDSFEPGSPNVWMFVGVNGVGKTTTIGKLARQQVDGGRSVLLAAGDTFRAAAAEQLGTWAERSGVEFVRGADGSDPSSVIFDGVERAAARNIQLVLADTAGRLHTKSNLMEELKKVRRVAERGSGSVTETLLVIDATTGQNGLTQAREFRQATDVTGVVLTKLDGSAKGGIVFAIETELGIPIKLVGVGEQLGDLMPFDPAEFVAALFEST